MIVAGVMSGTSADGINVALVRIADSRPSAGQGKAHGQHRLQLTGQSEYPYPPMIRAAVLDAMNATRASVADLARLDSLLGLLYADAVLATQRRFRTNVDLVGCHGQTLYHQGVPQRFLGRQIITTWQTGEAAWIAAHVGVPVVSDFRAADMAAGGKGAPLVPYLDYLWFRDERVGRIAQNIGGIANLTAIAAGVGSDRVLRGAGRASVLHAGGAVQQRRLPPVRAATPGPGLRHSPHPAPRGPHVERLAARLGRHDRTS